MVIGIIAGILQKCFFQPICLDWMDDISKEMGQQFPEVSGILLI
jgi:hypothetical protein